MQITLNNGFMIRQHLAWIQEHLRYMEVIGKLTDEQAMLIPIASRVGHIGFTFRDAQTDEIVYTTDVPTTIDDATLADPSDPPIWTSKERKYLQRARNRFGHGYNSVDEDAGVLTVKTRQKTYRYTLAQLANVCTKIKSLVEDRFGVVIEMGTQCSVCGEMTYRDFLECGHVDYSGLDLSKCKPGVIPFIAESANPHHSLIMGRLDEIDMNINRRIRMKLSADQFADLLEPGKNVGNAELRFEFLGEAKPTTGEFRLAVPR